MLMYLHELQNPSCSSAQCNHKETLPVAGYSPSALDFPPEDSTMILPGRQKQFDLIVKHPVSSLLKLSQNNDLESKINDFLNEIFNLSPNTPAIESPLVYDDHEAIEEKGSVTRIMLRFRPRDATFSPTSSKLEVCKKIHSSEVREKQRCNQLSHMDIFGLEPVPNTEFSAVWDAAFLHQLLQDGRHLMSYISHTMAQGMQREIANCTWLRVGIYYFTDLLRTEPQSKSESGLFQRVAASLEASEFEQLLSSLFQQAGSLLHSIKLILHARETRSTLTEWQNAVRLVEEAYDDVLAQINDFLIFLDSTCRSNRTAYIGFSTLFISPRSPVFGRLAAAQTAIRNSNEALDRTRKLYYSFRAAMDASLRAIMLNEKIWDIYYTKLFASGLFVAGSAYGLCRLAFEVARSGLTNTNVFGATLGTMSLAWTVKQSWDQWQYRDYCKSLETFLGASTRIIFYCDFLTRIVFTHHDCDQQFQHLEHFEWFRMFIRDTGLTPTTITLDGYKGFMECQKVVLISSMQEVKSTVRGVRLVGKQGDEH